MNALVVVDDDEGGFGSGKKVGNVSARILKFFFIAQERENTDYKKKIVIDVIINLQPAMFFCS